MKIQQNKIERALTTLLKMALHEEMSHDVEWESLSDSDWKDCYALAAKHGVMAVAFDGIQLLPVEWQPCRPIRLSWALAVKNYENRYERYCKTAAELSSFYAEHGIAMVQLKGVGLSSYYPVPSHREGGDIDIYTYSLDKSKMSDADANKLADKLMEGRGVKVEYEIKKHSNFKFQGIQIENHKTFLDAGVNYVSGAIENYLLQLLSPSSVPLCSGKYHIMAPSHRFNAVYLSCHAAKHYCDGMRLHHIFDWACLLKRFGLPHINGVEDVKLIRFIYSITDLCNALFDTNIYVQVNDTMSGEIYANMMHPFLEEDTTKLHSFFYLRRITKFIYIHRMQSKIFGRSFAEILWHSFIYHLKNPKTIFSKR